MRVFLLDDHEVVRRGLRALLESQDDIEVIAEAGTVAEALDVVLEARPDVAVLDVRLPDGTGIEVCRFIRSELPNTACIMLTSHADDEALLASVMAGASGYVLKQVGGSDLISGIRTVYGGGSLLDPSLAQRMLERLRQGTEKDNRLASLSPQERRILDLIVEGRTNREIGEALFLAEKTVKNYITNLLAKLGLRGRTEAAVFAARAAATPEPQQPS
jgi:DNA-binding NarL/FixJ family response regulator